MRVEIELTDKLKEYVDDYIDIGGGDNVFCYPDNIIKAIRDGIERQTGEWKLEKFPHKDVYLCSKCGKGGYRWYDYCPWCGSKNA